MTKEELAAYNKNYRVANADKLKEKATLYRESHREETNERKRKYNKTYLKRPAVLARNKVACEKWRQKNKCSHKYLESKRNQALTRKYGIKIGEFNNLLLSQGSVCAICNRPKWTKLGPCLDHDHEAGMIRGILCSLCNAAIGLIDDDPEIAKRMVLYLQGKK